jgi:hypothetical protein
MEENKVKITISKVLGYIVATALLVPGMVMAGGPITFDFDNAAIAYEISPAPLYIIGSGSNLTSALTLPVGNLVQLVAYQGGTNYVLASTTIGTNAGELLAAKNNSYFKLAGGQVDYAGLFSSTSIAVASNVVAGAVGSPLGFAFYAGTTTLSPYALVYNTNTTMGVPSPNYVTSPTSFQVELDVADVNWLGPRTSGIPGLNVGSLGSGSQGFYVIPEPSTLTLAGAGLLGLLALRRRQA